MDRRSCGLATFLVAALLGWGSSATEAGDGFDVKSLLARIPPFNDPDSPVNLDKVEFVSPAEAGAKFQLDVRESPLFRKYLVQAREDTRRFIVDGCTLGGVPFKLDLGGEVTVDVKSATFEVDRLCPPPGKLRFVFDVRRQVVVAREVSVLGVKVGVSTLVEVHEEKVIRFDLATKRSKVLMLKWPPAQLALPGGEFEVWAEVGEPEPKKP